VNLDLLILLFFFAGGVVWLARWAARSRRRAIVASAGLVLFVIALLARLSAH
jgi:hypothetical protein